MRSLDRARKIIDHYQQQEKNAAANAEETKGKDEN